MKKHTFLVWISIVTLMLLLVSCGAGGGGGGSDTGGTTDNGETTGDTTAPSAPTGVAATAGDGQVSISWNSVSGATSYNIYWSTTTGITKTTGTKISNATSPYTHTSLTNGTTYYYVVTAENSYGESSESSQLSATPQATAVAAGKWDEMAWDTGVWGD